jgi:hypothetical protein
MRYVQIVSFILTHQIVQSHPSLIDSSQLFSFLEIFCYSIFAFKDLEFSPHLINHLISFSSISFVQSNLLKIDNFYKILAYLLEIKAPNNYQDILKPFQNGQLSSIILKVIFNSSNPS